MRGMAIPNWTLIESTWRQWRGQALTWWPRLSEAEWEEMDGSREKLLDMLQLKYGWTREEALQEVDSRFEEYASSVK